MIRMGPGVVYLLHLDRRMGDLSNPRGQAQHYLGFSWNLDARLAMHREGRGAKMLAAARRQGIGWTLARTWLGGPDLEKALKRQHAHHRFCPLCKMEHG